MNRLSSTVRILDLDGSVDVDAFPAGVMVEREDLRWLAHWRDIIGADVTGERSPIMIANPFFRWLSAQDHPRDLLPDPEKIKYGSRGTNQRLCRALLPEKETLTDEDVDSRDAAGLGHERAGDAHSGGDGDSYHPHGQH